MPNVSNIVKSIQDIMRKDAGTYGDAQRLEQLGWMFFLKIFDDREKELDLLRDKYKSPLPKELRWSTWAADDEGITGDALLSFVNKINGIDFNATDDRHLFGDIYEKMLKDLQSAGNAGEFYTPRAVTEFIIDRLNPRLGESFLDPATGTGGFITCLIRYTSIRTNLLFFTKGTPTKDVWYYEHPYPPGAKSYNKGKPISIAEFEAEKAWWGKPDKHGHFTKREENERAWRVSIDQIKAGNFNLDLKNPHHSDEGPGDVDHLLPEYENLLAQIADTRAKLKQELQHTLTATAG
jgi:type I restriction-modification system DNA methylase subunit